jgi:hypothetical protein
MSRCGRIGDSDFVLIAGEMTHFDHTITKNPIKTGFCQCEEIFVIRTTFSDIFRLHR